MKRLAIVEYRAVIVKEYRDGTGTYTDIYPDGHHPQSKEWADRYVEMALRNPDASRAYRVVDAYVEERKVTLWRRT